jgi:hypothetical protein
MQSGSGQHNTPYNHRAYLALIWLLWARALVLKSARDSPIACVALVEPS